MLAQSQKFEQTAAEAFKNKDFPAFLANMRQAEIRRPNHPRLIYNLAKALALNAETSKAVELMRRLAAMGMTTRFENDQEFLAKLDAETIEQISQLFAKNRQPLNRAERAFSLPEKDLMTESVAFDAPNKRFFVSSIYRRKIVVVEANGATRDFSSPQDNLWGVFGIKIDEKRRLLWACTAALPQIQNFQKADEGVSGVFKYDLKTGKLLKKYLLKDGKKHVLGDLAVAQNGAVFATDSVSPNIYRINPAKDEIEEFLTDKAFASLQGIAFSPDEKQIFVADYSAGIFSIDLKTKKVLLLAPAQTVVTLGIDGLYFHKNKLIGIQNGTNPQRVVSFSFNPEKTQITSFETLEANHADFGEPTLGVIVGDAFYFIANNQSELVNEKGEITAPEKLRQPIILKLKL